MTEANSAYSFSEAPRAVPGKRAKYRDEDGPEGSHGNRMNNLMFDRRIYRGNTFHGLGPGTSPGVGSPAMKKKMKRRKEPVSIFDLRPKLHRNKPVNLDAYLIETSSEVPEVEVQTQTDEFEDLPPEPEYVPIKTGVDNSTQIEESDGLFQFDVLVQPILEVLVGKTLEQALQEVEEEEELADLSKRKEELYAAKQAEEARIKGIEDDEIAAFNAKEKRVQDETGRIERERVVTEKVGASTLTNQMIGDQFVDNVFDRMQESGYFKDATRVNVEQVFMPWIMDMVGGELANVDTSRRLVDAAIKKALHVQRQAEDLATLQREANAVMAVQAERVRDGPKLKGLIRINVAGIPGLDGPQAIGPVAVGPQDTIEQVEMKIQQWVQENLGSDLVVPEGGFLNAGVHFNGKPLESGTTLLDADVPDMGTLTVGNAQTE